MNAVYPEFLRALAEGEIDCEAVAFSARAVDATFPYDGTDLVATAFAGAELGDELSLPTPTVTRDATGVNISCDDSPALSLTGLSSLDDVEALVIYVDTGSAATSTLVAFLDRRSDTSPVTFTGTGDAVAVSFPSGYFVRL